MKIVGMMRVKNETRWGRKALRSAQAVCDEVVVLDDNSTDGTVEMFERNNAMVHRSPFQGLDEVRDKNYLLGIVLRRAPDWVLCLDGDEVIHENYYEAIQKNIRMNGINLVSFTMLYLWDKEDRVRIDGVFGGFRRASMFRVPHSPIGYLPTGRIGNLHGGMIPDGIPPGHAQGYEVKVLHYGSFDAELRRRKIDWYRAIDPDDKEEDGAHMLQGDPGEASADAVLKYAGPMKFASLSSCL